MLGDRIICSGNAMQKAIFSNRLFTQLGRQNHLPNRQFPKIQVTKCNYFPSITHFGRYRFL